MRTWTSGVGSTLLMCLGVATGLRAQAELTVSPRNALVDDRIAITVSGLDPQQSFTIRATTLDQRQRSWVAEARFTADVAGTAKLSEVATEPGSSYEGVDPMGLFWSAVPDVGGAQIGRRPGTEYVTTLELLVDDRVVSAESVRRRLDAAGVERSDVADGTLVGAYYRPDGTGTLPGVVVFAGSDGELASAEWRAALLASRGFAALAVAVFGYDGRPDDLVEIPLEYGAEAVSWLLNRGPGSSSS